MELKEWLKKEIDHYNSEHDEIVDKTIYHEYLYLPILALFYLKVTPKALILHSLQLMFYVVTLAVHVYFAFITIFKEKDFILIINLAHLMYILMLTMVLPITIIKNRQVMSIVHKIIGTGTYDYKEEIPDEEHKITKKYLLYKKILKTILPGMNILACIIIVFVGPWIDESLSGKVEIRDYDDEGINLKVPVHLWYPTETHQGIPYLLAYFGQFITGFVCAATVAACTCIFFTVCTHLIIQLERLIISVKNIQKRALKLYNLGRNKPCKIQNIDKLYEDSEFMKTLEYCFKQNIEHHQQIIR
uniref:Odorant receptor n=1 Tax=Rhodnius prolixus TaxID=13249 RepID=T1HA41_RHOPR